MGFISRGFRGKRREGVSSARVPPGQHVVNDFPVLSAGPTPKTPLSEWSFSLIGEVDEPKVWTWKAFRTLPTEQITVDIHCVTKGRRPGCRNTSRFTVRGLGRFKHLDLELDSEQWGELLYA